MRARPSLLPVDFFDRELDNLADDRLLSGCFGETARLASDEDCMLALSSILHAPTTESELFSRAGVFWKYENNVFTFDII